MKVKNKKNASMILMGFIFVALVCSVLLKTEVLFESIEDLEQENKKEVLIVDVGNKICPVFKEKQETEPRFNTVYKGRRYYFCCPQCIDLFEEHPERYLKRLESFEENQTTHNN